MNTGDTHLTMDDFTNALDSLEHRLQREIRSQLQPMKETLADIKLEVQRTNGRVTNLEATNIANEAGEKVRKEMTHEAAELVAEKAADALNARERSKKWWATVLGLAFTAVTIGTPTAGSVLRHFGLL